MIAAMRVMTQGAIFADGIVFPQERTALFGMAAVTIFIDGKLFKR